MVWVSIQDPLLFSIERRFTHLVLWTKDPPTTCSIFFEPFPPTCSTNILPETNSKGPWKPGKGKFLSGWWFQIFFYVHPELWGNDPIWRSYFSTGLVQPPTSYWKSPFFRGLLLPRPGILFLIWHWSMDLSWLGVLNFGGREIFQWAKQKKTALVFQLQWLFNKDPYNGWL